MRHRRALCTKLPLSTRTPLLTQKRYTKTKNNVYILPHFQMFTAIRIPLETKYAMISHNVVQNIKILSKSSSLRSPGIILITQPLISTVRTFLFSMKPWFIDAFVDIFNLEQFISVLILRNFNCNLNWSDGWDWAISHHRYAEIERDDYNFCSGYICAARTSHVCARSE